ncbi:NADH-dependent flavin oxidoreductase [Lecanosticta acicola]|uniref:NADH-dependent flavin oxidoreductase n=1 Tax=Lecanosticta acicola TaxID=111012 RepID=A0AAI9EC80_9PEZI|nr:NADH-dependent flavin oxidoreductase [Lecanosticta acicola]
MEYDKASAPGPPESKNYPHQSVASGDNLKDGRRRVQGPAVDTGILGEPIKFAFSGKTARNRFLKAPMTERLCHWNEHGQPISVRGFPSKEYKHLYRRWGQGEIGMIVSGNTMIRYDAVEAYGNPILQDDHDGRVETYREMTSLAKAHGSLIVAQLSHPGRQGPKALNPHPVSASDVQLQKHWAGNEFARPTPLTIPDIKEIVRQFGETAYLCHQAGFDGVQVHCAHGYLLAQFLALTTNTRDDEYGGSFENRSRIIFDIIDEIHRRVTDASFIICVKVNSVEFQPGGQTPEDCRNLCQKLEEARVDFIDLSGGTFEGRAFEHKKESTKARESYFIEFAELIRPLLTKTRLYVTGGFRTASGMVSAINASACDGIGIARPLAAEPYLCKEILEGKVTGAIENLMPVPKNTQASGMQLGQIGSGEKLVSDWSDEGEVKRWLEADRVEEERKIGILPVVDSNGYAPIKAVVGFEYLR